MTEGVGPKFYTNKPKKVDTLTALLKKPPSPSPASISSSPSMASQHSSTFSTPPPEPPKESFIRRYKFALPLLLAVNLAYGGYVYMRTTKKKDGSLEGEVPAVTSSTSATASSVIEKSIAPVTVEPLKLRETIPEDQQRELFKWTLEEKRKVRTKDPAEKKRIDQEKAIIKQFLRSKTIPPL